LEKTQSLLNTHTSASTAAYVKASRMSRSVRVDDAGVAEDIERTPGERTTSQAFRQGSRTAVQKVLEEVEKQGKLRVENGFSQVNFSLGVLNCFLITYVFAAFPQHLWILYVVEGLILFPLKVKFLWQGKPLNQIYYLLDYCWIMNIVGLFALVALVTGKDVFSDVFRKHLFLAAYGTACGPLVGATSVLPFISLIFHDLHSMTSVFIHFYPPLLFYILRWRPDEVLASWPNTFYLEYDDISFFSKDQFIGTVFGNTMIAYMAWFVPYFSWQWFIGLDLPRSKRTKTLQDGSPAPTVYDTVFHSNWRKECVSKGKLFWNRPEDVSKKQAASNDFEVRDFVVYMGLHFLCALFATVTVAYFSYLSKYIHGAVLVFLVMICIWRGAKRYTYYSTEMYAQVIRKQFAQEIVHQC